jgi:hypothetical protein
VQERKKKSGEGSGVGSGQIERSWAFTGYESQSMVVTI